MEYNRGLTLIFQKASRSCETFGGPPGASIEARRVPASRIFSPVMSFSGIDIGQSRGTFSSLPVVVGYYSIMCAIWIEQMKLREEAEFIPISDVGIIFIFRLEESVALVSLEKEECQQLLEGTERSRTA